MSTFPVVERPARASMGLREIGEVEAGAEDGADPAGLPEVEDAFGGAAQLAGLRG